MPNTRIYYATHSVAIKSNGGALTWTTGHLVHGVQSVGISSTFNLTPIFELGNISIYENVEGIPDAEVTMQKVCDGHPPLITLATTAATAPTLGGRSDARCDIGLAVYPSTNTFASGTPDAVCAISGAYLNSSAFTFATDGASFTEDATFVSNDVVWTRAPGTATGTPNYGEDDLGTMPTITWNAHMANTSLPRAVGGVSQSQEFIWDLPTGALSADTNGAVNHADVSVVPTEIEGITVSGTNPMNSDASARSAHIQSCSVSVNFNRESITELGRRGPYSRTIAFPTEVSSEFTVVSSYGSLVSHTEFGIFGTGGSQCASDRTNVRHRTIRLCTCDGLRIYLGRKNKLASVSYAGGDAGGDNVVTTYQYTTQNDYTVVHQYDPHASGSAWWSQRNTLGYLTE
jgi:hypothetical protein